MGLNWHSKHARRPFGANRRRAKVEELSLPAGTEAPNVAGRRLAGPSQGFGQLWRKRFSLSLEPAVPAEEVIREWRRNFSKFWPGSNELVADAIEEEEVVAADLELPAGTRVATGLVVLRSEERGFRLMTLQGHMFAGWVGFAAEPDGGATVVSVEIEMRAGDPIYEVGLMLGGHKREEQFWRDTLSAIAAEFGQRRDVGTEVQLLDRRRKWSKAPNVWYNAAIRTQVQRGWRALRSPKGRLHR